MGAVELQMLILDDSFEVWLKVSGRCFVVKIVLQLTVDVGR